MSTPYSVVCVIHNSAAVLPGLLESLEAAEPTPERTIVVDAGSSDDGLEIAAAAGCKTLDGGDVGFGAANNLGVTAVETPVTLLLNPDIVARDRGALGELATLASQHDALHAPRLSAPGGSVQDSAHARPGSAAALLAALLPKVIAPPVAAPWRARRDRRVGWAIAAALSARTATLRELGPFDPSQFLFYEDLDLCLRADEHGVPIVLHPRVGLTHLGAHSTEAAFSGEPFDLLAERRRQVVGLRLGPNALARDDRIQRLTLNRALLLRRLARRDASRARAQLAALDRARQNSPS